ncbi:hypothetical protein, partial [Gordonia rhizosphera]
MTTPLNRLAESVSRAKAGGPLTQVTIVVPNPGAGRDVTHFLARTNGVANTDVLTLPQLVNTLAAPTLEPRQPLSYPLL